MPFGDFPGDGVTDLPFVVTYIGVGEGSGVTKFGFWVLLILGAPLTPSG